MNFLSEASRWDLVADLSIPGRTRPVWAILRRGTTPYYELDTNANFMVVVRQMDDGRWQWHPPASRASLSIGPAPFSLEARAYATRAEAMVAAEAFVDSRAFGYAGRQI